MRLIAWTALAVVSVGLGMADDALIRRVRDMEIRGEGRAARQALEASTRSTPADPANWAEYAWFLDQRRDPAARVAFRHALELASGEAKRPLARRLAVLELAAGDRAAASRALESFHAAGGA